MMCCLLAAACALCMPAGAWAEGLKDAAAGNDAAADAAADPLAAGEADGQDGEVEPQAAPGTTKIHVLALDWDDAIVIESDGHFGIVDSGEDSTLPDGTDPRYPVRAGTSPASDGVEDKVIGYLAKIGVTSDNLDFYIGTHPHSDHIGSAAQVIGMFKPKRVYTPRYSDSYISDKSRLWDNQYVYDRLVSAARDAGSQLIQDFDDENSRFMLGSAAIELENTGNGYQTTPVWDANCFSLGVKVSCDGHTAFLAGDINNSYGEEDVLARTLGHIDFLKMGHHGNPGSNTPAYLKSILSSSSYAFQTGGLWVTPRDTIRALQDIGVSYADADDLQAEGKSAFVVTFAPGGVTTNYDFPGVAYDVGGSDPYVAIRPTSGWKKVSAGWLWFDDSIEPLRSSWVYDNGSTYYVRDNALMATQWLRDGADWYWFDGSGRMVTGWNKADGQWSYFDGSGKMVAGGWHQIGGAWYYLDESGYMHTGWLEKDGAWYWLDEQTGAMATGWQQVRGTWYYFEPSGAMATGWVHAGNSWYYLRDSGAMATGWLDLGGTWYYLEDSGAMAVGWLQVNGAWYYFDGSGAMMTGWQNINGSRYYFDASGAMATGSRQIGGRSYYFAPSGALALSATRLLER